MKKGEAFITAYQEAGAYLEDSKYCLGYEVIQGVEEPENFIVRIHWSSVEDHEQGFRKSKDFPQFLQAIKPFFG